MDKAMILYRLFIFLLCVASLSLAAQKTKTLSAKLYAYRKEVLAGAAPSGGLQEDGSVKEIVNSSSYQYYFYLETSKIALPDVKYLWMNGLAYKLIKQPTIGGLVVPGNTINSINSAVVKKLCNYLH